MTDNVHVTGPVSIESDSKSRVAFNMMQHIAAYDQSNAKNSREYWLTLYSQCYKATSGRPLKYVLDTNE